MTYPLLDRIDTPADLRLLPASDLPDLVAELREYFMTLMDQIGGHFGSSMGAVELTVALHYVFNTPDDKLVWDVGHQALIHKILTGRKALMHTLKKTDGLAPFPKRGESPYDTFTVGHSSTSIGAALGMALAQPADSNQKTVAIIGDGAMTAGMAFEALNHAGAVKADMLVILNDNEMSISENVGALSNYFARIISGKVYTSLREGSKKLLNVMPPSMRELASRTELHLKGMILPGTLFEELGFNYFGPFDGHDVNQLVKTLTALRDIKGPKLLHVYTQKGRGYAAAEADPIAYHAVSPGYLDKKPDAPKAPAKPTYSNIFGDWLCDMAAVSPALVAITPAMREGSGMVAFSQQYPAQYMDVGIAEQHSVTVAAGLACEGKKPIVAIYSTFLQRAYDQLIHDVCLPNLPVLFALDRAGLVGPDGPTHHGSFDLSYLSPIPNMVIMAPTDEAECRDMLTTGYRHNGPAAVRYPRGAGIGKPVTHDLNVIPIGKGVIVREGQTVAILCFGPLLHTARVVADKLDCTLVNMRFIKPLDTELIRSLAKNHQLLVTIEENAVIGGAGSGICQQIMSESLPCSVINLGLPDQFMEHGDLAALYAQAGLDAASIEARIMAFVSATGAPEGASHAAADA
ncbi:MAG: 1-deoxy-D-xylulose-5-phosphate synthase [Gammaproteobacteria bacterium]